MPDVYSHPLIEHGMTLVQAVTGPGTMFPLEDRGTSVGNISDGSSNTLLFVQADLDRAVPWTAPDDLFYDPDVAGADPGDGIGESYFGLGTIGAIADGSVRFLSECLPDEVLHELIQIADGGDNQFWGTGSGCAEGTVDPRPGVGRIQINTDDSQRSTVSQVSLTFDDSVDFEADAFSIVQRSDGDGAETGDTVAASFTCSIVGDEKIVTITFDSHVRNGTGVLEDGNYQLTIDGSKVFRTSTGLAMGADVVFGDSANDGFFSLFGDNNGDRRINAFDLLGLRQTWLATNGDAEFDPVFDYNNDEVINAFDLLPFRQNFRKTLPFV
jgi:hypothetical protein